MKLWYSKEDAYDIYYNIDECRKEVDNLFESLKNWEKKYLKDTVEKITTQPPESLTNADYFANLFDFFEVWGELELADSTPDEDQEKFIESISRKLMVILDKYTPDSDENEDSDKEDTSEFGLEEHDEDDESDEDLFDFDEAIKDDSDEESKDEYNGVRRAVEKIITTMENYEPVKARFIIGSNIPNSYFVYKGEKILVKTNFDTKERYLAIDGVDEDGQKLLEEANLLTIRTTVSEDWEPKLPGRRMDKHFITRNEDIIINKELFYDILIQVADNIKPYIRNPKLHITLEELEEKLKPGRSSVHGFLAEDERLWDIIEQDKKTLEKAGVTYEQIAEKLFYLINQREKQEEIVDDKFKVEEDSTRGMQGCPWGILDDWAEDNFGKEPTKHKRGWMGKKYKSSVEANTAFTITNIKTGESISVPYLSPHLIGDHHFFEGHTEYRMEPEKLVRVLELLPKKEENPKEETDEAIEEDILEEVEGEREKTNNKKEIINKGWGLVESATQTLKEHERIQNEMKEMLGNIETEDDYEKFLEKQNQANKLLKDLEQRYEELIQEAQNYLSS